jgi:hypothetical protein
MRYTFLFRIEESTTEYEDGFDDAVDVGGRGCEAMRHCGERGCELSIQH